MQTKINNLPESQIEIEFEITPEEFEDFKKETLSKIKENFETDGYRKGKAPEEVILKNLGEEKIMAETANLAIQKSFEKAVLENNFQIVSKPTAEIVKFAKGNPFHFKIKACIVPGINLPNYKEIAKKVEKKKISIAPEEVEESLKWIQKSRSKFTPKNDPAKKGDFIEIEYTTSKGETHQDAFILGQGRFFEGVEDSLIGMKSGEEKKGIKTKDKEGKEVSIDIKVLSVKEMDIPELNDDFAKSLGNFESMEKLKENLREGLLLEKERGEKERTRAEIIEKIANETDFEAPKDLKEKEKEAIVKNFKEGIKQSLNLSFEDYLEKTKKKEEELDKSFEKEAEKKVKGLLILREIAMKEKISVEEKELEEETQKILSRYKKEPEISPEELKAYAKEMLVREKAFQILENCV